MKYVLGIDPGLSGGLALYDIKSGNLQTFEMPVIAAGKKSKSGKLKNIIDESELARFIDEHSKSIAKVVMEEVWSRPGQSSVAMFNFGMGFGIVKGIVAANFLPVEFVTASTWKKKLRVGADKQQSRLRATEIFPRESSQWNKAKWDGKAESAMIAYYGAKYLMEIE